MSFLGVVAIVLALVLLASISAGLRTIAANQVAIATLLQRIADKK